MEIPQMMNSGAHRELIASEVKRCRDAFEGCIDEVKSRPTQAAQIHTSMLACAYTVDVITP